MPRLRKGNNIVKCEEDYERPLTRSLRRTCTSLGRMRMDTNIRRSTRNRGSLYKSLDENILVVDSLFAVRKNNARISIASDNESEESSDSEVVLIDDSDASEQPTNKRKKTDESLDNVDQASDSYLTDSRKSDSGELPRKQTNKVSSRNSNRQIVQQNPAKSSALTNSETTPQISSSTKNISNTVKSVIPSKKSRSPEENDESDTGNSNISTPVILNSSAVRNKISSNNSQYEDTTQSSCGIPELPTISSTPKTKDTFLLLAHEHKLQEFVKRLSLTLSVQADTSSFYIRKSPNHNVQLGNSSRVLILADLGKNIRISKYENCALVDEEIWPKAGGNWKHLLEALLIGLCFEFFNLRVDGC